MNKEFDEAFQDWMLDLIDLIYKAPNQILVKKFSEVLIDYLAPISDIDKENYEGIDDKGLLCERLYDVVCYSQLNTKELFKLAETNLDAKQYIIDSVYGDDEDFEEIKKRFVKKRARYN